MFVYQRVLHSYVLFVIHFPNNLSVLHQIAAHRHVLDRSCPPDCRAVVAIYVPLQQLFLPSYSYVNIYIIHYVFIYLDILRYI